MNKFEGVQGNCVMCSCDLFSVLFFIIESFHTRLGTKQNVKSCAWRIETLTAHPHVKKGSPNKQTNNILNTRPGGTMSYDQLRSVSKHL